MSVFEGATMMQPEKQLRVGLRTHWFRMVFIGGLGAGGCMAVVLGFFDVLERDPKEAFGLLRAWGPWALVITCALVIAGKALQSGIDVVREGMRAWVSTAERQAQAQVQQAEALTRLADQGGRSSEEVRRLATYAAQEFPTIYTRFDNQDEFLKQAATAIGDVGGAVKALHRRMDDAGFGLRKEGA